MNKFDIAISCYEKSINLNASDVESYLEKADCFEKQKMYEKALECYTTISELFPLNYQAIKSKGYLLEKLGRIEEAQACYTKWHALFQQDLTNLIKISNKYS